MSIIRCSIYSVIGLTIAACGSLSVVSDNAAQVTVDTIRAKPGLAAVCLYRPSRFAGGGAPSYIEFNGEPHSNFTEGYISVDLRPGKNTITAWKHNKTPDEISRVEVYLAEGEVLMLKLDVSRKNNDELVRVEDKKEMAKAMLSLPHHKGAYQQLGDSLLVDRERERKKQAYLAKVEDQINLAHQAQERKDFKMAIGLYVNAIKTERGSPVGDAGRNDLIALVEKLKHKPETPEGFRNFAIKAKTHIDLEKFDAAAADLMAAINAAPWLAEPYYNYALLEEQLGNPGRARWALGWFAKISDNPEMVARAKDSRVRLGILQEEKVALNNMNGTWVLAGNSNATYKVKVDGNKLTIYAPSKGQLDGTIKGNVIEGYFKGRGYKLNDSSVSPDRKRMFIKYSYTEFKTQYQKGGLLGDDACVNVTPYQHKEVSFVIIKQDAR